ncbi:MAG: hypothetical protein WC740_15505 [Verrucomicrobiia bacterium]
MTKPFSLVIIAACVLAGCATQPQPVANIPPMPPKPSTSATASAIDSAAVDAAAAQSNVKAGRAKAKADDAPAAVPLLDQADSQLDATLNDLAVAKSQVTELEAKIKADRAAHDEQVKSYTAQVKERDAQLIAAAAERNKLTKQVADLKNEVLRKAQLVIGGVGATLLLAAAGCFAAWIWLGFGAGWKVALVAGTVGATAVALAMMLKAIVVSIIVALGAAVAGALGYTAWHLWRDSRDTLHNVVAGVQEAKTALSADALATLKAKLAEATSDADKSLIETIKSALT